MTTLDHAEPKARALARSAFVVVGQESLPTLEKAPAEGGPVVRKGAVEALVGYRNSGLSDRSAAETPMAEALGDLDAGVRVATAVACRQLGLKGAVSEKALSVRVDALSADDPDARTWALTALTSSASEMKSRNSTGKRTPGRSARGTTSRRCTSWCPPTRKGNCRMPSR